MKSLLNKLTEPLSYEQKLLIARNICAGMIGISAQKIVHRDLAARNILLNSKYDGKKAYLEALVGDFGLSRFVNDDTEQFSGKGLKCPVKWTAPEALMGNKQYSTKSDVWSYGITLYELIEDGKDPFPKYEKSEEFNLLKQAFNERRPIRELLGPVTADINTKFSDLMFSCLDYDPNKRFYS